MKYTGLIFVFGIYSTAKCLEPLRKKEASWAADFDVMEEVDPIDNYPVYMSSKGGGRISKINMKPILCGRGTRKSVLLCPTKATVINQDKGSTISRIKAYLKDADAAIGLGYIGSNTTEDLIGDVLLPEEVVNSESLLTKLSDEDKYISGVADNGIQCSLNIASRLGEIRTNKGCKTFTVADFQDSVSRSREELLKQGYRGRDMETGWFLGYSNSVGVPAGSVLVVSDLAGDGKLADPKTGKPPLELDKKATESMEKMLSISIETLLA